MRGGTAAAAMLPHRCSTGTKLAFGKAVNRAKLPRWRPARKVRRSWPILIVATLLASVGCSSVDRSRALDNPAVPAEAIARQVCGNCHGTAGRSVSPNFPNLAGQVRDYLIEELMDFRARNRRDPAAIDYMWGMAHGLTDVQILGLAEYFSRQRPAASVRADEGMTAVGRRIYERNFPDKDVPACGSCHGVKGEGSEQFPRLAAQHADYLIKQIQVFKKTDERPDGAVTRQKAHDLSPAETEAVSVYLQSLP